MFNRRNPSLFIRAIYAFLAFVLVAGTIALILVPILGIGAAPEPHETARENIRKAEADLKKDPKDVEALQTIAASHQTLARPNDLNDPEAPLPNDSLDQLSEAVEALQKAEKIEPKNPEVLQGLALALRTREELRVELAGRDPDGSEASVEPRKGVFAAEQQLWQRLTEIEPEETEFYYRWAKAAEDAGNPSVAVLAYRKVLELEPDGSLASDAKQRLKELSAPAAPAPAAKK